MCKQLLETHGRGGQGRQIQKPCDIAQESEAHVEAGSSYIYFTNHTVQRVWPPPKAATGKGTSYFGLEACGQMAKAGEEVLG